MNNVSIIIHRTVFGQVVSSLAFQLINHAYNPTDSPALIFLKKVFSTYFFKEMYGDQSENF